jgi:hypothetical protein
MTGYDIYVQWCRERNRKPPSKAWWDNACAKNTLFRRAAAKPSEAQLDNRELERQHKDWPDA